MEYDIHLEEVEAVAAALWTAQRRWWQPKRWDALPAWRRSPYRHQAWLSLATACKWRAEHPSP